MEKKLRSFLLGLTGKIFQDGVLDCSFMVGDWCFFLTGVDPIVNYRDLVSTKYGCMKLIKDHGDLCAIFSKIANEHGFVEIDQAGIGAIAVVDYQKSQFGAIKSKSGKWAMMLGDGLLFTNKAVPLKIWKVI